MSNEQAEYKQNCKLICSKSLESIGKVYRTKSYKSACLMKWAYVHSGNDCRVAKLPKSYLTVI